MIYKDVDGHESAPYNIDIEFSAVEYLDIPKSLSGISINEIKDRIPKKFSKYTSSSGLKIYEIKSNAKIYYILAGGYRIGKNEWELEDRISNMELEYDEILASSI
ncbi:hypothetical protein SAMN04487995_3818 [Dyadobacter koreensis]|uniref:Uncharacterized protein n=2 Tax=Dyadobacter koreensis TaxID=408657 RepID=A0A1H6XH53_9BACT|nr:hypothetical protein SAMN04487995_3818 [Dyadobacter koreensis]